MQKSDPKRIGWKGTKLFCFSRANSAGKFKIPFETKKSNSTWLYHLDSEDIFEHEQSYPYQKYVWTLTIRERMCVFPVFFFLGKGLGENSLSIHNDFQSLIFDRFCFGLEVEVGRLVAPPHKVFIGLTALTFFFSRKKNIMGDWKVTSWQWNVYRSFADWDEYFSPFSQTLRIIIGPSKGLSIYRFKTSKTLQNWRVQEGSFFRQGSILEFWKMSGMFGKWHDMHQNGTAPLKVEQKIPCTKRTRRWEIRGQITWNKWIKWNLLGPNPLLKGSNRGRLNS